MRPWVVEGYGLCNLFLNSDALCPRAVGGNGYGNGEGEEVLRFMDLKHVQRLHRWDTLRQGWGVPQPGDRIL